MIDSLVYRIKQSSLEVSSEEISDTVKLSASLWPTIAALSTGALGSGATYLAMKQNRREQEEKALTKALMYGAAGALGGFGAGKIAPTPQILGSSPLSSDPGSSAYGLGSQDMNYIMGR